MKENQKKSYVAPFAEVIVPLERICDDPSELAISKYKMGNDKTKKTGDQNDGEIDLDAKGGLWDDMIGWDDNSWD